MTEVTEIITDTHMHNTYAYQLHTGLAHHDCALQDMYNRTEVGE